MSSSLPREIFDLVIDQLRDEPTTLRACCLVSKSWIPRARRHLFAHVAFDAIKQPAELWMKTFPDPSNSPAHHTRGLTICSLPAITTTDASVASWIRTFRSVVHLHFECVGWGNRQITLNPFYGFSHTVKSLRLILAPFEVFDLICSFPLLEDLALVSLRSEGAAAGWTPPSASPRLTGSLELSTFGEIRSATSRLLEFPDLRFTKITVSCMGEDFGSVMDLASRCSGTLESLNIYCSFMATPRPPLIDLSKVTELKDLTFRWQGATIRWIVSALQTIESKNLHQLTIHPNTGIIRYLTNEAFQQQWQDLDQLLVQFWASHSIRPQFVYPPDEKGRNMRDRVLRMLPELTNRGLVDPVEDTPPSLRTPVWLLGRV